MICSRPCAAAAVVVIADRILTPAIVCTAEDSDLEERRSLGYACWHVGKLPAEIVDDC